MRCAFGKSCRVFDWMPFCRPSSLKLLENYNKRMQPGDPAMPCVAVSECPCWTEEELDLVVDDGSPLRWCGQWAGIPDTWDVEGRDSGGAFEWAYAEDSAFFFSTTGCWLRLETPTGSQQYTRRRMEVSFEDFESCRDSIIAECESRDY